MMKSKAFLTIGACILATFALMTLVPTKVQAKAATQNYKQETLNALHKTAAMLYELGNKKETIKVYQRILEINPTDKTANRKLKALNPHHRITKRSSPQSDPDHRPSSLKSIEALQKDVKRFEQKLNRAESQNTKIKHKIETLRSNATRPPMRLEKEKTTFNMDQERLIAIQKEYQSLEQQAKEHQHQMESLEENIHELKASLANSLSDYQK